MGIFARYYMHCPLQNPKDRVYHSLTNPSFKGLLHNTPVTVSFLLWQPSSFCISQAHYGGLLFFPFVSNGCLGVLNTLYIFVSPTSIFFTVGDIQFLFLNNLLLFSLYLRDRKVRLHLAKLRVYSFPSPLKNYS